MIQEHILADLKKRGITLISVAEPDLDNDDPDRVPMRHITGAIAEWDRKMVVAKLRAARERKGKPGGRYAYGHDPHRTNEADSLNKMLEWRKQGLNRSAIARRLNEEGYARRDGKPWQPRVVARILIKERPASTTHKKGGRVSALSTASRFGLE